MSKFVGKPYLQNAGFVLLFGILDLRAQFCTVPLTDNQKFCLH